MYRVFVINPGSTSTKVALFEDDGNVWERKIFHESEELAAYRSRLEDRFGPVPACVDELISTITLRRMAKAFGIEKLILKQDRMVCHLVSNQQSPFYQSGNFTKLIQYVQSFPRRVTLKETPERLSLSIANVKCIATALEQLRLLTA